VTICDTLVKPEWLKVRKTEAVEIIVDKVDLLEEVRKSKVKDDEVVKAVEEIKWAGVKMLRDEECKRTTQKRLLFKLMDSPRS